MVQQKRREAVSFTADFILKGPGYFGSDLYRLICAITALKSKGKQLDRKSLLRACGYGGVRLRKAKQAGYKLGVIEQVEKRDLNGEFIAFDYLIKGGVFSQTNKQF